MFEFQYVEVMNWAYWPTMKLPLDQRTIMITGPNGSGKTTFLDALRTLLRAPRLSAGRRFNDYLIGNVDTAVVKAVVTNEVGLADQRPFEQRGLLSDSVTLAVLMQRRAGRWEKRFAILADDVPLEDLRKIPKSELISPSSYSMALKDAGFTEALIKVLALEQGQTDKLCEKSPRELMDLLLEVHGDKRIIDRYKKVRENYHSANMEINQLGARLAEEQSKLLLAERAAEAYRTYERLKGDLKHYESVLIPQAEYVAARQGIEEAKLELNDFNLRLNPLEREIMEVQTKLDNADTELQARKNRVAVAREQREGIEKDERQLDIELNTLVQERRRLTELLEANQETGVVPIKPLQKELDEARRELAKLELREDELRQRLARSENALQAHSHQQHKIYPPFVSDFMEILQGEAIDFDLLCDVIEIEDRSWQLAIESILGRDRFTIIVDRDAQAQARRLAERSRYRSYIVERAGKDSTKKGGDDSSAIAVVSFAVPWVPDWIVDQLRRTTLVETVEDGMRLGKQSVSVTRQGYRQDRRGGVSIAVDRFYCGALGQSTQSDGLKSEVSQLQQQLRDVQRSLKEVRERIADLEEQIDVQNELREAEDAAGRKAELDDEISSVNSQHKVALEARREAERKVIAALEDLNNFERDCEEQRRWLLDKRGDQGDFLNDLKECQQTIQRLSDQMLELEEKLGPDLLAEKALNEVPELDELTPRYYAIQSRLEEYETAPDESAVHIYEHHKAQFDRQQELYKDHEAGLRNWEAEYRLAREKYLAVVEHTIREYRKNVLALSERAGLTCEVIMPNLRGDDGDHLEEAELQVRFGFDGKRAIDISGASHSGGQRVVASLVLLMSLATSGGGTRGGFFIIDEPFAHLSIERIDDVSHFLARTQCQFILTSPTTHNVNVFSAARLQLNFRIKKPDADWAAIPTVIRRG